MCAGLGVALGVLVAGLFAGTRIALTAALVLAAGVGVGIGFGLGQWDEAIGGGAGGALGALGALLGALAREARAASLVAVLVVLPIVFLGLIPSEVVPPAGWVSAALPFAHAVRFFSSALYDLSPWEEVVRQGLWLVALGLVFVGLARVAARRLLA